MKNQNRTTPTFKIFKGVCKVKGFQGAVTRVHSIWMYLILKKISSSETAAPQKWHCTTQKIISFDHGDHAWTIRFSSSTSGRRPSMSSRRTCVSLWVGFETSGTKFQKITGGEKWCKIQQRKDQVQAGWDSMIWTWYELIASANGKWPEVTSRDILAHYQLLLVL